MIPYLHDYIEHDYIEMGPGMHVGTWEAWSTGAHEPPVTIHRGLYML